MLAIPVLLVMWRADPFRVPRGDGCARLPRLLGRADCAVVRLADRTGKTSSIRHQYVSKFARSASIATVDLIAHGVLEADAAGPDRLIAGHCRRVRSRPQAAAHRHGLRRVQLRRHHAAGRPGAAELSRPVPLVRRQDALVRGRGRRRSELVHRIQRADRTVGALLWALRGFRHPAGHRSRQARIAPCVARAAATRPSAFIRGSAAFVGARGFQTTAGIEHFLDARQLRHAGRRIPIASTTTMPPA